MGASLYTPEGLLAEFTNPETESAFSEVRLAAEIDNVRRTLVGVVVAMAAVAAMDASLLRGSAASSLVLSARGLVGLSSLLGLWVLRCKPSRARLERVYIGVWLCLGSCLAAVAIEQEHGVNQPWQVFYFASATLVAFLPCRLRVGMVAASMVVAGALSACVLLWAQTQYVAHIIVGTLGAFGVGYSIVRGIERLLRQDYLRAEQLRADRTVLEQTTNTLRAQLVWAQQAHAVGVLAAGTTHDFNNMLMAIRANALSVRDSIAPTSPLDLAGARDASEDILEAVDSASDLSRRLLMIGKPSNSCSGYVNFDQAAQRVLHMMQRLVPKRIALDVDLNAGNRMVAMQGTYLEQIVSNLIVNALEAIPGPGTISVFTRYDSESGRVRLCVSDDGVGMSQEQVGQVFQPFFTTKPTGNGLGLPTVKLVVEESQGDIRVESNEGKGTFVHISLPVAATGDDEFERPAVSGFVALAAKQQHTA
jgi:signal transduction histidine kinase